MISDRDIGFIFIGIAASGLISSMQLAILKIKNLDLENEIIRLKRRL